VRQGPSRGSTRWAFAFIAIIPGVRQQWEKLPTYFPKQGKNCGILEANNMKEKSPSRPGKHKDGDFPDFKK
jgi:hypothetical protein